MKQFLSAAVVLGLLVFTGCNTSPTGGGGAAGGTFKLNGPETSTEVKQDSEKSVKITLDRKGDFKEDVKLSAAVSPSDKGVTASVKPGTIKTGDASDVEVAVKASKEARGDYTVTVTGTPAKGDKTSVDFKVKVPEK
jgi:uncharacterized membrane protein